MLKVSLAALVIVFATAVPSTAEPAGRALACIKLTAVDGDTIKCDGVLMRDMGDGAPFVSGYDTPEITHRKCDAELALGRAAKSRMSELLETKGLRIIDSGRVDATRTKRPLVWILLPDGRSVGSVLIGEGLARRWTPDYVADWCSSAGNRAELDL